MARRLVSIWLPNLLTDWFILRQPALRHAPFVVSVPDHGRMVVTAASARAQTAGIHPGMAVADARAMIPALQVLDDKPGFPDILLGRIAEWCIRFTPLAAVDPPDGLMLDVTGCSHLWGGDQHYIADITKRLHEKGYHVRMAMADTAGVAWAVARFGKASCIVDCGEHTEALLALPPEALRLQPEAIERLHKLGLRQIRDFISVPRSALRRRFGQPFLHRLDQALGLREEMIHPVYPVEPYQERLPCLEPIVTATGIEIALQRLLEVLCLRLEKEQKGLRAAIFKGYRTDGKVEKIEIGTNHPTHNAGHLLKLFAIRLATIAPASGIELFILEAPKVENVSPVQEKLWESARGLENMALSRLLDRLAGRFGAHRIHRYVPDEHYWPERSIKRAASLQEKFTAPWRVDRPRPLLLLTTPELIEVTAPIPDYPPMLFRHKGKLHTIAKADGPERIEQEWWLQQGQHRDYYYVEDKDGRRFWIFRSGHYDAGETHQWFLHGFFV